MRSSYWKAAAAGPIWPSEQICGKDPDHLISYGLTASAIMTAVFASRTADAARSDEEREMR